eukprot:scaffold9517_cov200-Amphora_coffeaeformis.AAC.2
MGVLGLESRVGGGSGGPIGGPIGNPFPQRTGYPVSVSIWFGLEGGDKILTRMGGESLGRVLPYKDSNLRWAHHYLPNGMQESGARKTTRSAGSVTIHFLFQSGIAARPSRTIISRIPIPSILISGGSWYYRSSRQHAKRSMCWRQRKLEKRSPIDHSQQRAFSSSLSSWV